MSITYAHVNNECFYEKVIKVKADVAAVLNSLVFFCELHKSAVVTWEAVKGAPEQGA